MNIRIMVQKFNLLLQSWKFSSIDTSLMTLQLQRNKSILVATGGKIDLVDAIKTEKWTVSEISRSLYVFNIIKLINDIHTRHKYIFQLQALAGQMFTFT